MTHFFIVTLFKHILCELRIPHNDLLLIVMILLLLVLIHVVLLPPTQSLSQNYPPLFLPFLLFINHQSIISTPILQSVPPLRHKLPIFHHIFPPEYILWLSFDSVTTSHRSLLFNWSDVSVRHYIFETDLRHYHLSTSLLSSPQPKYTQLLHLFYNLQLLKNIIVDLTMFSISSNTNISSPLPMEPPMDLPMVFYTTLPMTLPTVLSMILPTVLTMVLPTDLPIVSSLVPDTTCIILPVLLSPYPNTSLPFHFHCIIYIEFTYHLLLYHNHYDCIKTILPILQLLTSSFHLKYTFLFSHCDTDNTCPFDVHLPFVQSVIPSWYISTHLVLSNTLGDSVSCSCSFLYLSPHRLHSHSFFTR